MGGVGKTTLIKNLNNELEKCQSNQLFSIVIWVVVSRQRSIKVIQSQIAERLKLQITSEESEHRVASRLCKKLMKEKSFLLILDDMWDEIDLDQIGVPRLDTHKGSKIILTSRSKQVCRQMLTDIDFEVHHLSHGEAMKLFSQTVGEEVIGNDQIKPWAEAVLEECNGLPLAIVVVGASMRKKTSIALWRDPLDALRSSTPRVQGIEEKVFKPLKWSYDFLMGEQLKSCFLFLCLFPEDFEIHIYRLVQYWLPEGLLDPMLKHNQLLDRCVTIVDDLKDSCLLESGLRYNHVKMHDVVRDVGVWIATSSEDACKSIVRAGVGETQISKNCFEGAKRISYMNNNISALPDCEMQCLATSTLFLQGNQGLQQVPNSFLQGFEMLTTLDLSESGVKSLPHSLLQLGQLKALLLSGCKELTELPPLAALGMLQVLDCSHSAITRLPQDLEKLMQLRQLDLSYTRQLLKLPKGKFPELRSLEFLSTTGCASKWGTWEMNEENAPFEELLCLDKLIAVYIDLEDIPHVAAQHVSWPWRVNSFFYLVTGFSNKYGFEKNYGMQSKVVVFQGQHFSGEEPFWWLLVNASRCEITACRGVDLMFSNMLLVRNNINIGRFAQLKVLKITDCCISVKTSSTGESVEEFDLLPNLEGIFLNKVTELESLSDLSNFLGLSFTKMRHISVHSCPHLVNLLAMDKAVQNLVRVETIRITCCENLTRVIYNNTSSDNFVLDIKFLQLVNLPALEEICRGDVSWQTLEGLEVIRCNVLNKLPLGIQNAERIRLIIGRQDWWDKLQWDTQHSKMRLQPLFQN